MDATPGHSSLGLYNLFFSRCLPSLSLQYCVVIWIASIDLFIQVLGPLLVEMFGKG